MNRPGYRIYFEDVDAGGVLYHSRYLNLCERARSETLFERGLSPLPFVVVNLEAHYQKSARLGDWVWVATELGRSRCASLVLQQSVWREEERLYWQKVVLAYLVEGRPSRIPPEYAALFSEPS